MTSERFRPARVHAVGALLAVLLFAGYLLLGSGGGNTYHLLLQNGGQLVNGNQVEIGGKPVGSITSITLTDNSQADVTIETDRVLHEGTTAIVRSTSLSGEANRYVSLSPGPNNFPVLGNGAVIAADKTTSPVDLDQLFNTLDGPTRAALRNVIQGSATAYAGVGPQANQAYHYLSPALVATDKLFQELDSNESTLSNFLVSSSRIVTAVAQRRQDLASLIPNANQALGAIASQNNSLDLALRSLPGSLRQANTTFFNLRAALGTLDPLVATSKPATRNLASFLSRVRPVVKRAVPVFSNLRAAVDLAGPHNDLPAAVGDLPALQRNAASALQPAINALSASQPVIKVARPYSPDIFGAITKLGQITGYYDADGHYARIQPAGLGLFHYNSGTQGLQPIPPSQQFNDLTFGIFRRCPGGSTQPNAGWLLANPLTQDHPFLDGGALNGNPAPGSDCNSSNVPPGP